MIKNLTKLLIFIGLLIAVAVLCVGCTLNQPTYRKLTMFHRDGTQRVFVGQSVWRGGDDVRYVRSNGYIVYFKGDYLIETVSKQYYDDYRPPAEARE